MPDYGLKVAEEFQEYLRTGDISLIEKYSVKELKTAVSLLSPYYNNNKQWYREIERRVDELSKEKNRNRREIQEQWQRLLSSRWLDKIIAFVLGLLGGLLLQNF